MAKKCFPGISTGVLAVLLCSFSLSLSAQGEPDTTAKSQKAIEQLTYQQQPGLAMAASKIFFSEKRWSLSGFGEFNYVPLNEGANPALGDIELYYTGLYRFATFFGYRITDKIIWNSEFQIEFLHDGIRESHHEIVIEAFVDFIIADYFKARVGFYPLTIGYVNNNDEPIMFYSVNRSEVERLIVPSTWIELGVMFYGNITPKLSYVLGFSQGLNAANYLGGTWVRQGREIRVDVPESISINPQLIYSGIKNVRLSVSGYFGESGQGRTAIVAGEERNVRAPIALGTAYAKYDYKNLRLTAVGAYGTLNNTDRIFALTEQQHGAGQVLGSSVYGYLFEAGYDLLPHLRKTPAEEKKNWLMHNTKMKLPVFLRYERLNTHLDVHASLADLSRVQNDLDIITAGINFMPRENVTIKGNYQWRYNHAETATPQANVVEFGIGFIF